MTDPTSLPPPDMNLIDTLTEGVSDPSAPVVIQYPAPTSPDALRECQKCGEDIPVGFLPPPLIGFVHQKCPTSPDAPEPNRECHWCGEPLYCDNCAKDATGTAPQTIGDPKWRRVMLTTAPMPPDALDAERLAEAMWNADRSPNHATWQEMTARLGTTSGDRYRARAAVLANEYAALTPKEPTDV